MKRPDSISPDFEHAQPLIGSLDVPSDIVHLAGVHEDTAIVDAGSYDGTGIVAPVPSDGVRPYDGTADIEVVLGRYAIENAISIEVADQMIGPDDVGIEGEGSGAVSASNLAAIGRPSAEIERVDHRQDRVVGRDLGRIQVDAIVGGKRVAAHRYAATCQSAGHAGLVGADEVLVA